MKKYLPVFSKDIKIDHFRPLCSNDVTKIEDTFYIEWQSKFYS